MANQSAKRIAQQNALRISTLNKVLVGVNAFYLFVRVVLQFGSLNWTEAFTYVVTAGIEVLLYMNLYQISRPRYDPGGILVSAGTDLSQPGLVSYMFDYIYITWFVHLLSLLTKWAWALYLSIPLYLLVLAAPYIRQYMAKPQEPAQSPEDAAKELKRREKKERKQRTKYVRG